MDQVEPIVAVFDTKYVALRAIEELRAAEIHDIWLAIVRGEDDDGKTTVAQDGENEDGIVLQSALSARGTPEVLAGRYDGILPPGTAVMSLRVETKVEHAVKIIELTGGHIDY